MTREELEKGKELMEEYDCLENFRIYIEKLLKKDYHNIKENTKSKLIECVRKEVNKIQKELDDKFKNLGKYDF